MQSRNKAEAWLWDMWAYTLVGVQGMCMRWSMLQQPPVEEEMREMKLLKIKLKHLAHR